MIFIMDGKLPDSYSLHTFFRKLYVCPLNFKVNPRCRSYMKYTLPERVKVYITECLCTDMQTKR
jgi:hypothetical protein